MTGSAAITAYWDDAADAFDDEPDHGLTAQLPRRRRRHPAHRRRTLRRPALPAPGVDFARSRAALREWTARLRPGGLLILVEGRWREAGQSGVPYVAGAEVLP